MRELYYNFFTLVPKISLENAKLKVYEDDLFISVCVELKSNLKRDVYVTLGVYEDTATGMLTIKALVDSLSRDRAIQTHKLYRVRPNMLKYSAMLTFSTTFYSTYSHQKIIFMSDDST